MNERASATPATFGDFLQRLRKRAGMTQEDLAAAIGYSRSLIAALERDLRLPDVEVVIQTYLPALGLQEEPRLAAQLIELAALARGARPPASFDLKRTRPAVQTGEEATRCFPVPPTEILGRDEEIGHLCDRMLGHHGRLLTLCGPPGVGKTRLALAVGAQMAGFYRDGACFVTLAPISDPALVVFALLAALQLPEGSVRPPRTCLIEHLRRREMLLVLDNFEQLVSASSPAVALVAELLAECPDLHLLVTSRERLHLRAEQRYRVQPLALGAAVDLFVQRCAAVDAEFALTQGDRAIVAAICKQVDRLPLAIELCAAETDLLSLPQLLASLQNRRLELLVGGAQDLPPHQRTLRKAIGHSYDLLDDGERGLFRSLGVFEGGCELEEIGAVSAWNQELSQAALSSTLHALIGKSLVRVETMPGGAGRYQLLETIREFALEQARAEGEEERLRRRHFDAYLQLFRTANSRLRGPEAAVWLARLEPEQDNLRAALQWTLDARHYTHMAWLILAVNWYWDHTGRWHERGRWIARLLPHREALDADLRLAIFMSFYAVAHTSDELQPMDRYTDEMLGLLAVCPAKLLHAAFWRWTGAYSTNLSDAAVFLERAIACARAARDEPGLGPEFGLLADCDFILGHCLGAYADHLIEHGAFARAVPLLIESAQIFQARGSRFEMADSIGTLGRLALLSGDMTKAHTLLLEAVTLAREFNYQEALGNWQPFLGLVTLYGGDVLEAHRLLEESLHLCLDLKNRFYLARVYTYLAETALWEGKQDETERWLTHSLAHHADQRTIKIEQLERLWLVARLATAKSAYPRAATLFGLAEKVRSQIGYEPVGPARLLADAALSKARAALGPSLFAEAFAAGQQLSLDDAFAAISVSSSVTNASP